MFVWRQIVLRAYRVWRLVYVVHGQCTREPRWRIAIDTKHSIIELRCYYDAVDCREMLRILIRLATLCCRLQYSKNATAAVNFTTD